MSRFAIEDRVLKISVGIKAEAGLINTAHVRALVAQLATDVRAPADVNIAGFLDVEDIPQDRRSQFLVALDNVARAK